MSEQTQYIFTEDTLRAYTENVIKGMIDVIPAFTHGTNMIDNHNFSKAINQRGKTEYVGNVYGIDRWLGISPSTKLTIEDDCILLQDPDIYYGGIQQWFEDVNELRGKTVTFSAITKGIAGMKYALRAMVVRDSAKFTKEFIATGDWQLVPYTFTIDSDADMFGVIIQSGTNDFIGNELRAKATKLELGTKQTLAHYGTDGSLVFDDPMPNKALELVKAQRHQIVFGREAATIGYGIAQSSSSLLFHIPTPVMMRGNPTIVYENIGLFGGVGGLTTDASYDITGIVNVFRSENGIRGQANTAGGLTPGNAYVLVVKPGGSLIADINLL